MLRVIELFAGIGSQTQALKNIGIPHKVVAISEIDPYCDTSYRALHNSEVLNLGDITKIPCLPEADLWTYSFPCTDISVAGKLAGCEKGSGTRSGLLWEVERLLLVAKEQGRLPKYLLLENVKNLVGVKFKADYDKWLAFLNSLGYSNHWKVLNAKNYGIPQNRERVYCVSILGDEGYVFPNPIPLELRLKNMLETEVPDRYYITQERVRSMMNSTFNSRRTSLLPMDGISTTLMARDWKEPKCVVVGTIEEGRFAKMTEQHRRVYGEDGLAPTLTTCGGGNTEPKVMIGAMRGRNPENPSLRKAGINTEQRLEIGGEVSNALTTVQKDNLVVEPQVLVPKRTEFGKEIRKDYENGNVKISRHDMTEMKPREDGIANTLTSVQKDNLVVCERRYDEGVRFFEDGCIGAIRTYPSGGAKRVIEQAEGIRVRKLTPKECYRLMGWKDEQIDKIIKAGISKTQQYKQAGNGIVVQVLEAIFRQLFENTNLTED